MDGIFKNLNISGGISNYLIYRDRRTLFQHKLHEVSQIKIFLQLNLHKTAAYKTYRKSDCVCLAHI